MKNEANYSIPLRAKSTFGPGFLPASAGARAVVWSIAGSDCGGGAGLQADIKAMHAFGVHACTAVAALTAQNSLAVRQIMPVDASHLDAQLIALAQDMPPQAIKTGLLGSVANLRLVCQWVDRLRAQGHEVALVVDPVLGSSTGESFADDALIQAYLSELIPRASLVTPNQHEATRLGLHRAGALPESVSVVITGGDASHAQGAACDWLSSPQARGWLSLPRVDTVHHHGTGCTFASTAAAALASGYCVADAVVLAKMGTSHALRGAYPAGAGAGPVNAQPDFAQDLRNLPALYAPPARYERQPAAIFQCTSVAAFARLHNPAIGVYAVVDSVQWVQRVLRAGIRTVQLRIKDAHESRLAQQIQEAVALARGVEGAQLFINDHWALALQHGAYGVHLGQEDLERVDLDALRRAEMRLGISTHSYWEVARANALRPSYIACGPIFATTSKDMPWVPQGVDNLRYWAGLLETPVVGIGGIDKHSMRAVAATGCAGAAVISALTRADDPAAETQCLMEEFARGVAVG